jgi:hypothetical protein
MPHWLLPLLVVYAIILVLTVPGLIAFWFVEVKGTGRGWKDP